MFSRAPPSRDSELRFVTIVSQDGAPNSQSDGISMRIPLSNDPSPKSSNGTSVRVKYAPNLPAVFEFTNKTECCTAITRSILTNINLSLKAIVQIVIGRHMPCDGIIVLEPKTEIKIALRGLIHLCAQCELAVHRFPENFGRHPTIHPFKIAE